MLCENCKAEIPSLKTRLKRVNDFLHALGLYYHETLPLSDIDTILEANGFQPPMWSYSSQKGETQRHAVGTDKWLTASFHRMDSGRWEVVAYVN